jgi:hypothetical protein
MTTAPDVTTSMAPPAGAEVPARLETLSAPFLTACLRHCGAIAQARVIDFEATRIGEGQGFAGQLARVTLRYDRHEAGAPDSVVAKLSSPHAATRDMLDALGGYLREVRFYRELAGRIGIDTPRCYLAHYDAEQGSFFLLLEDMSPAAAPALEAGLSVEQVKLVLERLAGMHARWWNRVDEVGWLIPSDAVFDELSARYRRAVARVSERLSQHRTFVRVAAAFAELIEDRALRAATRRSPQTLTHGDLHLENVFLPMAAGGRFALIDWQSLAATRHGTMEVTRILCTGMRPELRRAHERELLVHYHSALCAAGVRGFSLRQLRRRYREETLPMVMVGVIAFDTVDLQSERAQRTLDVLGERLEQGLRDARLGFVLFWVLCLVRLRRWLAW